VRQPDRILCDGLYAGRLRPAAADANDSFESSDLRFFEITVGACSLTVWITVECG